MGPHHGEHLLGLFALDPARVSAVVREHVTGCPDCLREAADLAGFDDLLTSPSAWPQGEADATRPERPELILFHQFDDRHGAEYRTARALLQPFESPSAAARFAYHIPRMHELHTGGGVRRLCELANGMCERHPLYALTFAQAAVEISRTLDPKLFPGNAVHDLRGQAWKEKANAFRFLGQLPEAMQALDQAEAEYGRLRFPGLGLVAVQYVRAWVLLEQERLDEAERSADAAALGAMHFGDAERHRACMNLLGIIAFDRQRYAEAMAAFEDLLREAERTSDDQSFAYQALNLAHCLIELHRPAEASSLLDRSLRIYIEQQMDGEASRVRWAVGRRLAREGRTADAIRQTRMAMEELRAHGMLTDAAMAAVDLAELLLAVGRNREVAKVLSGVAEAFTTAGKITGALAALAYLKDAALSGTATGATMAKVRRFLRLAERQPALMFP